jgi:hypothetical protein
MDGASESTVDTGFLVLPRWQATQREGKGLSAGERLSHVNGAVAGLGAAGH